MFRIFKKKKADDKQQDIVEKELQLEEQPQEQPEQAPISEPEPTPEVDETPVAETPNETIEEQVAETTTSNDPGMIVEKPQGTTTKAGLFARLKQGLSRTGSSLTEGVSSLVLGKKQIDDEVLEELETRLLMSDVGVEATMKIIDQLTEQVKRKELSDVDSLMQAMYAVMVKILRPVAEPLEIDPQKSPTVILMVGINGAGKTTTIGKLAKQFQSQGKSVMLAAGDTFRAAAVEQLQVWGERNDIPVIAQGTGADSASVIYDAMESAKARGIDVLLADTAGRLHTQDNLMEELKKVKRVMQKIDPEAPHETMLIIDASIGQNALAQAKEFDSAIGLSGITVTKLDGTAKGGILFAIAEQAKIPVRYIGVGERIDDLQEFDPYEFVGALLAGEE